MNVTELIEALKTMPEDAVVVLCGPSIETYRCDAVSLCRNLNEKGQKEVLLYQKGL